MPRSVEVRLRRLEERQAARRVRYVVVERPEDAPVDLAAGPGEQVYVIITGVPREPGFAEG
jgi:hypothetical protein